ncbi:MAG: GNAT family N-acetyltransferase [Christensenellaceae bacterium]|jgi:GNAT superfamily N-acetyltransferase|nr:GNAT family N-acetyltransferase [Christensenellaceae bacterium]
MNELDFYYKPATESELIRRWDRNIAAHPGDGRWPAWKAQYLEDNRLGRCRTFVILVEDEPIGEGTLLYSPECGAIGGRLELADGERVANINALRIEKAYEGQGHISKMVRVMEQCAKEIGYRALSIGVEAAEARNLAIYLHWGFRRFLCSAIEDGALVLYYEKRL